jgi:hypothetical protein
MRLSRRRLSISGGHTGSVMMLVSAQHVVFQYDLFLSLVILKTLSIQITHSGGRQGAALSRWQPRGLQLATWKTARRLALGGVGVAYLNT